MKRDKFAGRYIIKIGSSVFIVLLNIIVNFILPRAFSVEQYGFYTFNLNVFNNIVGIANLSTSNALSAKYSKRNEEVGIVRFYLFFFGIMTAVLSLGLIIAYQFDLIRNSLGGQTLIVVMLGLEAAVLNKLLTDTITIYDSIAVSRFPALMQIVMKICMAVFVISTFILGYLNIIVFYVGQAIIFSIIIFILLRSFFRDYKKNNPSEINLGIKQYFWEFYFYCKPLVLVGIFSQVLNIFMDVTLLQNSGATVRAMYGASTQLNTILVYLFSPYAELSKREFAIRTGNKEQLIAHLIQSLKIVIWMTAFFAIFIAVFSNKIVPFVFGERYINAVPVVIIMMSYTIYQSWGQLLSSFLLSTEQTKKSAMFSVVSQLLMLLGFLVFIRPNFIWPSGLGAEGMALARAVANFVYVVVMASCIAKSLGLSVVRINFLHILEIALISIVAIFSYCIVNLLNAYLFTIHNIIAILIGGCIYSLILCLLVNKYPTLIGLTREQLLQIISSIKSKVNKNAK